MRGRGHHAAAAIVCDNNETLANSSELAAAHLSAENSTCCSSLIKPLQATSNHHISSLNEDSSPQKGRQYFVCSSADVMNLFHLASARVAVGEPDTITKEGDDDDDDEDDDQQRHAQQQKSIGGGVVCSMCGDVGLPSLLFLCNKCSYRHQHKYCSRSYPDMGTEASICNWCLHYEDLSKSSARMLPDKEPANTHERNHICGEKEEESAAMGEQQLKTLKRSHSKAFEYLLLVCFPHTQANCDGGRDTDDESVENSDLWGFWGSLNKKADRNLAHNQQAFNLEGPGKRLDNITTGPIPKRQRCTPSPKGVNTASKCRSKGLQLSPSRPNYRRYKLLADVLC